MEESENHTPVEPSSLQINITDNKRVVLHFDDDSIPPIRLTPESAKRIGGNISSYADKVDEEISSPN